MRILITGGAGFIGRHLVKELLGDGHEIHVLDIVDFKPFQTSFSPGALHVAVGSVLDVSFVDRVTAGKDLVIHLAAIAEPIQYCSHPKEVMDVTLQGSLNVIRSAVHHGVRVLFASTSEIYGYNPQVPWAEEADRLLGPTSVNRWCYATAKAAIEHYLFACCQEKMLDFVIARFFNVYGPGLKGRVIDHFIRQALAGVPLQIHGDGNQIRTFLFFADAMEALKLLIPKTHYDGRAYNIGNTTPVRIGHLAKMILELTESASPLQFVDYSELHLGFSDIPMRIPSIDRIEDELRWRPKTALIDGLRLTIDTYRSKYANVEQLL